MQPDLELINFRIPASTKQQFIETCRSRNQQMTSVLNQFIADFISENQPNEDNAKLPLDFFSDAEPRL
jgi:hypothetical protein